MYADVDSQDDSSCASNKSWNESKDGGQEDQKNIVYDDTLKHDKIDDLNEVDVLHLRNGLAEKDNGDEYININQQGGQTDHFCGDNNSP